MPAQNLHFVWSEKYFSYLFSNNNTPFRACIYLSARKKHPNNSIHFSTGYRCSYSYNDQFIRISHLLRSTTRWTTCAGLAISLLLLIWRRNFFFFLATFGSEISWARPSPIHCRQCSTTSVRNLAHQKISTIWWTKYFRAALYSGFGVIRILKIQIILIRSNKNTRPSHYARTEKPLGSNKTCRWTLSQRLGARINIRGRVVIVRWWYVRTCLDQSI